MVPLLTLSVLYQSEIGIYPTRPVHLSRAILLKALCGRPHSCPIDAYLVLITLWNYGDVIKNVMF